MPLDRVEMVLRLERDAVVKRIGTQQVKTCPSPFVLRVVFPSNLPLRNLSAFMFFFFVVLSA